IPCSRSSRARRSRRRASGRPKEVEQSMQHSPFSKSGMGALAYGIFSYGVFLGVFVYAVGFIAGFLTPTRLDGEQTRPLWQALAIDLGLLGLFAVQHSVMARPAFKRWWTRLVPEAIERSTYVLFPSPAVHLLYLKMP